MKLFIFDLFPGGDWDRLIRFEERATMNGVHEERPALIMKQESFTALDELHNFLFYGTRDFRSNLLIDFNFVKEICVFL